VPKQEEFDRVSAAIATHLRQARLARKLSMNAVAERGGISQQMVSYVERGIRNPTIETLLRMSVALDIDLAEVIADAQRQVRRSR
jgi:transcriptional regulator with XRE-family HTH domain